MLPGRSGSIPACGPRWRRPGSPRRGRTRPWPPSGARRPARRRRHRHGVGQVAGLPAAGADRDPRAAAGAERRAAPPRSTSRPPRRSPQDQLRRRSRALGAAGRAGRHLRRRHRRRGARLGPRARRRTSSPTPTCCTARCCRATRAGRSFLRAAALRRGRRVPPYRGVFGSHVAQVLRRLRRVCAHATAPTPTFVLASATVGRARRRPPSRLTGLDVIAVTDDGSPRGEAGARAVGAAAAPTHAGENGAPVAAYRHRGDRRPADRPRRRGRAHPGVRPVAARRRAGRDDRAGTGSPRSTPSLPRRGSRPTAAATSPRSAARSSRRCAAGELLGLAATNALELGIDVSGLDAVLLAGFPGTRASLWQQVGPGRPRRRRRARRSSSPATTRSTPTSSTTRRRCSASRSRRPSSTRTTPTSSARTCARPPPSCR